MIQKLENYIAFLINDEKSAATIEKYERDVRSFIEYLGNGNLDKDIMILYKRKLTEAYATSSVNSMLVAINCFLKFIGRSDCCVKLLKIQRQIFSSKDKELNIAEYRRLLKACSSQRTEMIIRTICETGIRISELKYITVEAVQNFKAVVDCKSKRRVIFIPKQLKKDLLAYIKKAGVNSGSVFVTKSGQPINRCNVWRDMKALCEKANVSAEKVFPHNLRHLFARTFYETEHDIVRLADVLGHSSIDTTRIYTIESGEEHFRCLDRMYCRLMT